jgi:hypothetical protein
MKYGGRFRPWPKPYLQLLFVATISLLFFLDRGALAWRSVDWIRQGFLAVFVDSGSFINGCF